MTALATDLRTTLLGLQSWLVRRKIGPYQRFRRLLARTQWMSPEELTALQLDCMRRLLRHARRHVPFYRDRLGHSLCDIASLTDLATLPILTKQEVAEAGETISPRRLVRLTRTAYTGGTTGTPLRIRRDLRSIGIEHAFVRRQWEWAGLSTRDCCAYLTGRVVVPPDQEAGRLYRYDPVMRELILSTYHLSPRTIPGYLDAIRDAGAVALVAYPSAVYLLARGAIEEGAHLRLRAVLTTSETLNDDARRTISDAFGCPVYDFYGSAERVCYINTCEHGTYHIASDYGYTELHPAGDDSEGKAVVATGFWNYAMPLVRYRLGDTIIPGSVTCTCGRAFPTVSRILGRPGDQVCTPSGRRLGAAALTHLLYGAANIVESQLEQDAADHVTLRYVPTQEFGPCDLAALRRLVAMHLPSELRVDLHPVEAIPRTSSGKFRPIVSSILG